MSADPPARLIVSEVRAALERGLAPGFAQKVAANALGIAQRELERAAPAGAEDMQELADRIRGAAVLDDALIGKLIELAIARMEIDQPTYPPFRAWKDAAGDGAGWRVP
ncbi:DUF6285 domain-containing protein [Tsuneonella sp. YG55]|uniref:DUF6285 domain-containing protein n=1 Tax=Tsuneonella litorea TaxID=2976475 RepID=A0A9X2VYL6_9SPHN|nr:DUF6285 domain-containing protein [Tsuneonella litorea]MCT2557712.1 DUF6285 domain-containing protein [Tsuneonella litorea]